jgi:DNA processing protein
VASGHLPDRTACPSGGVRAIRRQDPDYPPGLADLLDAPPVVFVRGITPPPAGSAVVMVGSRAATSYGLAQARRLAADLARLGLTVVSGLARGVDAAAHGGALAAGGRTVAVLPGGLDAIVPRHHLGLAEQIAARGTLLSEIAAGVPDHRGAFLRRNRLIAALASATVVIEAAERSGALSTARTARLLGRAVLAVPGDVDRTTSRGCNALLRSGAQVCERAGDVLAAIAGARPGAKARSADSGTMTVPTPGATPESRLLAVLSDEPCATETLAARAGVTLSETLAALLALQWAGAATPLPGQRWVRARSPA